MKSSKIKYFRVLIKYRVKLLKITYNTRVASLVVSCWLAFEFYWLHIMVVVSFLPPLETRSYDGQNEISSFDLKSSYLLLYYWCMHACMDLFGGAYVLRYFVFNTNICFVIAFIFVAKFCAYDLFFFSFFYDEGIFKFLFICCFSLYFKFHQLVVVLRRLLPKKKK